MTEDSRGGSQKTSLTRVSAAGRRGMTVKTVVQEQPKPRAGGRSEMVTSGRFLSAASTLTVANRKSGFLSAQSRKAHSAESRHGLVLSEEPDAHHHHRLSLSPHPAGQGDQANSSGGALAILTEPGEEAARASGPSAAQCSEDVDICMGLAGLVLVGEEDDILVKGGIKPYISVGNAINDLLTSPWHKYYQRPPLNTPGLLAIGERCGRWQRVVDAPCTGQSCLECLCCWRHDDEAATATMAKTATETLLVFHSDDIAVALNCSMQATDRGDAHSPMHTFIDMLKEEGRIEEKLCVRWVGFDSTFPGVNTIQETTPIHAQVARRLGYWPRYNFYDHCLDIVKDVYAGEAYDPSAEYGMGRRQLCSVFSFHWRGGVPEGVGWNQRDEHYYHG